MDYWPGYDEAPPVILPAGRPGRHRPRLASEHMVPRRGVYYRAANGQLMVPGEGGGHQRASSVSGNRPAVVIENNNYEEHYNSNARPLSFHGAGHGYEVVYDERRRDRSRSRVRVRTPSPYGYEYEIELERREERRERRERKERAELETMERLKKLDELERREEEARAKRRLDEELLLKKLDDMEKKEEEARAKRRVEEGLLLKKLDEIERKEEEARAKRRLEEEILLAKAKEEAAAVARKAAELELERKAVAKYKAREEEERAKKKEEKKRLEDEMRKMLANAGYSESHIERTIRNAEKAEGKGEGKTEGRGEGKAKAKCDGAKVLSLGRPTWIKVHRKHMDPDTLDAYQLPWEWAEETDYIVIKQWISEYEQDILFEHTRKLRERKQITYTTTELKKQHDQLLLVKRREPRKKSPVKTPWFLT